MAQRLSPDIFGRDGSLRPTVTVHSPMNELLSDDEKEDAPPPPQMPIIDADDQPVQPPPAARRPLPLPSHLPPMEPLARIPAVAAPASASRPLPKPSSSGASAAALDDISFDDIALPTGISEREHDLRQQVAADVNAAKNYAVREDAADLEAVLADEAILIGGVSLADVQLHQERLVAARTKAIADEQKRDQTRLESIQSGVAQADKQLRREKDEAVAYARSQAAAAANISANINNDASRAHDKAARLLHDVLANEKQQVYDALGSLQLSEPISVTGGPRDQGYPRRAPRLLRVRVDCMRAVKNKLPQGKYAVMCTIYDRLGGKPLRSMGSFAQEEVQQSPFRHFGFTPFPQTHTGKYQALQLQFMAGNQDNRIFLLSPSHFMAKTQNVIIFEVFALRSQNGFKPDRVVAWGAFPLFRANLELVEGSFKVPLLRGELDLSFDKYSRLEQVIAKDVDRWLCNLYFDTRQVPLEPRERRWYGYKGPLKFDMLKVDMQWRSDHIIQQTRLREAAERAETEVYHHPRTFANDAYRKSILFSTNTAASSRGINSDLSAGRTMRDLSLTTRSVGTEGRRLDSQPSTLATRPPTSMRDHHLFGKSAYFGRSMANTMAAGSMRNFGGQSARNLSKAPSLRKNGTFGIGASFAAKFGYQGSASHQIDEYGGNNLLFAGLGKQSGKDLHAFMETNSLSLETEEMVKERRKRAKTLTDRLRTYKHSLTSPEQDVPTDPLREKFSFLLSEIGSELSPSQWFTVEFWITMLFFALSLGTCVYLHKLFQYIVLYYFQNWPVWLFEVQWYTVNLQYPDATAPLMLEIAVVAVGVFGPIFCFCLLLILPAFFEATLGVMSDYLSRFLLAFGIMTPLSAFYIGLVEGVRGDANGDMFKLANYFTVLEGSPASGALITLLLYTCSLLISAVVFYFYLHYIHMNGRMVDVHQRLTGDEGAYFVPHDQEISVRVLRHIIKKCKTWKGFHGTTRKVMVRAYAVLDHTDKSFIDKTYHISIYNYTELKGKQSGSRRDLFRRFIRQANGTICEIFPEGDSMGSDEYLRVEERLLKMEAAEQSKLMKEREDLRKAADRDKVLNAMHKKIAASPKAAKKPQLQFAADLDISPDVYQELALYPKGVGSSGTQDAMDLTEAFTTPNWGIAISSLDDEVKQSHARDNNIMAANSAAKMAGLSATLGATAHTDLHQRSVLRRDSADGRRSTNSRLGGPRVSFGQQGDTSDFGNSRALFGSSSRPGSAMGQRPSSSSTRTKLL